MFAFRHNFFRRKFAIAPFPYGKLAGLLSGFLLTLTPLGMAVGFLIGALFDRMAKWQTVKLQEKNEIQQAFSVAAIALFAQVAKADGSVSRAEVKAFRNYAQAPKNQQELIGELFNAARNNSNTFAEAVEAIRDNKKIPLNDLTRLIDCLCSLAELDGGSSADQRRLIMQIAESWSIDILPFANSYNWPEFQRQRRSSHSSSHSHQNSQNTGNSYQSGRSKLHNDALNGEDPYTVLGVDPSDDLKTIKKAYKKRVIQSHPDRLKAQGKSDKEIKQAEERLMQLNAAFDKIEREKT